MAWIKLTQPENATGLLHQIYEAAKARAGRVWNILRIMSPNPLVLKASMRKDAGATGDPPSASAMASPIVPEKSSST